MIKEITLAVSPGAASHSEKVLEIAAKLLDVQENEITHILNYGLKNNITSIESIKNTLNDNGGNFKKALLCASHTRRLCCMNRCFDALPLSPKSEFMRYV